MAVANAAVMAATTAVAVAMTMASDSCVGQWRCQQRWRRWLRIGGLAVAAAAVATTTTWDDRQQQHNNQHDNQYDNNTTTTTKMNVSAIVVVPSERRPQKGWTTPPLGEGGERGVG